MAPFHVWSKVCNAPFHVRSKVCIYIWRESTLKAISIRSNNLIKNLEILSTLVTKQVPNALLPIDLEIHDPRVKVINTILSFRNY